MNKYPPKIFARTKDSQDKDVNKKDNVKPLINETSSQTDSIKTRPRFTEKNHRNVALQVGKSHSYREMGSQCATRMRVSQKTSVTNLMKYRNSASGRSYPTTLVDKATSTCNKNRLNKSHEQTQNRRKKKRARTENPPICLIAKIKACWISIQNLFNMDKVENLPVCCSPQERVIKLSRHL